MENQELYEKAKKRVDARLGFFRGSLFILK